MIAGTVGGVRIVTAVARDPILPENLVKQSGLVQRFQGAVEGHPVDVGADHPVQLRMGKRSSLVGEDRERFFPNGGAAQSPGGKKLGYQIGGRHNCNLVAS